MATNAASRPEAGCLTDCTKTEDNSGCDDFAHNARRQVSMLTDYPPRIARHWLRVAVAAQCFGNAWAAGWIGETPLMSLWGSPRDVGGWGLGETVSLAVCRVLAVVWVVCGCSALVRPVAICMLPAAMLQCLLALAMWQTGTGFPAELATLSPAFAPVIPWLAQAARIAAPLVLWMVATKRHANPIEWVTRVSIALTFAGHGIEAWVHFHEFSDMLLVAARRFGIDASQSTVEHLLTAIGIVDLAAAILVVAARRPSVAAYMASWGLVTAASRIVTKGWYWGWDGTATRLVHFALPLLLALWWYQSRQLQITRSQIETSGKI
jgi:hypothetical protein